MGVISWVEHALTRDVDHDELVSAILEGAFETPLWSSFLAQLRRETRADFATMIFQPPGQTLGEALHLFSGDIPAAKAKGAYERYLSSVTLLSDLGLEEGSSYALSDVYPPKTSELQSFYRDVVIPNGVNAARMIKVTERTGVSAWLMISRRGNDFGENADVLMTDLVPTIRGALRNYVALERERFTSAVTGDAMRRLYFAWMTLDSRGHVLDYDPEVNQTFSRSGVLSKGPGGRLIAKPAQLERQILDSIRCLAENPQARPRAFTLKRDPWLDILLVPANQNWLSVSPRAMVIAYLHGDSWQSSDRCEQLIQLFGLSQGEARLALALSRGMTISEAAVKFGLKTETARKYSKSIYAKTGARGLPDLVRIVMRSVLALAPER